MNFNKCCTQNLGNSGGKLICKFIIYFEGQFRSVRFGSFGNERLKCTIGPKSTFLPINGVFLLKWLKNK